MAQSSYLPSVLPVAIISPQFCAPYPVDLTIASKLLTINKGDFTVTDVNGNVMFRIKGRFFTLHGRHILLDAAGNPMLTLQHKEYMNCEGYGLLGMAYNLPTSSNLSPSVWK